MNCVVVVIVCCGWVCLGCLCDFVSLLIDFAVVALAGFVCLVGLIILIDVVVVVVSVGVMLGFMVVV